jgi:hypothetical protein
MVWLDFDHIADYNNIMEDHQKFPEFSSFLFRTLLNNSEFRNEFTRKYYYHLNKTFNASRVIDAINYYEKIYAPLVSEHIYRWHNPVDYPKWQENVDWLKSFAIQRPLIVAEQLQQNFGNPFTIYPNPGYGDFWLDFFGLVEEITVKVYSLKGELMHQWMISSPGDDPVFVKTGLLSGCYLLQITVDNMVYYSKLLIL